MMTFSVNYKPVLALISLIKGRLIRLSFFACFLSVSVSAQDLFTQQKRDRLFNAAIDLFNKNQFGAARNTFEDFLLVVPSKVESLKKTEAQYHLTLCAIHLYHLDAEKLAKEFIERNGTNPKISNMYFHLAGFLYQEKKYEHAVSYYDKVNFNTLSNPDQHAARFKYGYCQLNQKKLKKALEQFNIIKTQEGMPFTPAASYYAGFIEYGMGNYEQAIVDFKRSEQNESYAKIVPYMRANAYYKQKKYTELINYTTTIKYREEITNQEELILLEAESFLKIEKYNEAFNSYESILSSKKNTDQNIYFKAGYAAYRINNDKQAIEYFKMSFTDRDTIGFYSAYYLGLLYIRQQQKPMALTAFDIARKNVSDSVLAEESTFQYAKVAYDLGQVSEAIQILEQLLKNYRKSIHINEAKELLSTAYVNSNNFNGAIEHIESLAKRTKIIDKAYQKATLLKGLDFFNKENYIEAIVFLEQSLQYPLEQNIVDEAHFWCGESYSILKKYNEAISHYLKVSTTKQVDDIQLLTKSKYALGYCYFNLNQYDQALSNFKQFVEKASPSSMVLPDASLRLADCYYVSKQYAEAMLFYKKAITLHSSDTDYAYFQLGTILGILQKYSEADQALATIIKKYSQSNLKDKAIFQQAQLHFEQGHYETAIEEYSKLIKVYPSSTLIPYAYTRRAASNFNLKEYDKTSNDYIKIVDNFTSHPVAKDALLALQESLHLAGRSSEFDFYLGKYKQANTHTNEIELVEFESAKNLYFNANYKQAVLRLETYLAQYPESPRLNEAKYYLAESYYRNKEIKSALKEYYSIDLEKQKFSAINRVIARIAELEFISGKYEQAIPQFYRLINLPSNKKDLYIAWNGLMESYFSLKQYDSSLVYANHILEKGNINLGAANKASLYIGKIALEKEDYNTAIDYFLITINAAQDEYGAEAKYRLAEIFYKLKDHKQCYITLLSLNADFATYTNWVGKSYLLLSENFLVVGDVFNAKAVLKSLIDNFPLTDVKLLASKRLTEITQSTANNDEKINIDTIRHD